MNRLKPLGRTLDEFLPLNPGEQQLLNACRNGEVADLGDAPPESATVKNIVRATFLRFLLLGGDEQAPVHDRGVQLAGSFVEGSLDLRGCHIPARVALMHCRLNHQLNATDAVIDGFVTLQGCYLIGGLAADRLRCSGSVFLRSGFKAMGKVRLLGAQIFGDLNCNGGQFEAVDDDALWADGANIKGDLFLSNDFKAVGKVRLVGAQIEGDLICKDGLFDGKNADALSADRVNVKGSFSLSGNLKAIGTVRLRGAQIGGNLNCSGGQFEVENGESLVIDGADIKGDVSLSNDFRTTGGVRLLGTKIGGDLNCKSGQFELKIGDSLSADRADIKGSVFLHGGFNAKGNVRLVGTQIGGSLNCSNGKFEAEAGIALLADRACINGSVFLREGFKATGKVRLLNAQIGGSLNCNNGHFEAKDGEALSLEHIVVRGAWHLYDLKKPIRINASHAQVSVLMDELSAWAPDSILDGLNYATLGGRASTIGANRLTWLRIQSEEHLGKTDGGAKFRPQPWRQVQRVLREMGHIEDAKQIGIAFENHLRAIERVGQSPSGTNGLLAGLKRQVEKSTHRTFGILAGYGYRPIRLVGWMFSVWLLCGSAYWWLALPPRSAMAPADPLVFQNPAYEECQPDRKETGQWSYWRIALPPRSAMAPADPLVLQSPAHEKVQPDRKETGNWSYWWLALPPRSAMAPADPLVFQNPAHEKIQPDRKVPGNWYLCESLRGEYSTFSPLAYSLDVLLPVVDLGQEKTWGAFVPTPKEDWLEELFAHHWGHAARLLVWFETLFGWLSSLLLVAIISGFSRRNDDA